MTITTVSPADATGRLQAGLLTLLLGITLLVFGGVCGHEFVHFDDDFNIYNNARVKGLTWENLQWMFTDTGYARRYMPLGWLSYAVDYQLFGLNPQAYHVGNLLWHLVNVALLFFLLKQLLRISSGPAPGEETERARVWCAAIGTLFWAVNPLRVENVAWASARIYAVAFGFALLWLLAWLRARDPETPAARRRLYYWGSVAAYAASLLTYPVAMFGPIALFILEVYPLRRIGPRLRDWWGPGAWHVWRDKAPFMALAVGMLALTYFSLMHTNAHCAPVGMENFPASSRVMQAFYIWAYYVWKPWAPYDLAISYMTLHSFNPFALRFLLSASFVVGVSVALFLGRRRWPAALALWLCHLAWLVPFLGLTEFRHSPYDRYSYLSGILWSAGLALLLQILWRQSGRGYFTGVAVAGASLVFGLLAWQQVPVWRDTIPLHRHLLSKLGEDPERSRFDLVLGLHYRRAGLTNEAVSCFENAISYELRRPSRRFYDEGVLAVAHQYLGEILAEQGQHEKALARYQAAVQADPTSVSALLATGVTLAELHRDAEAEHWLKEAVRIKPDSVEARLNLAVLLKKTGNEQEARQHLEEAKRLQKLGRLLVGK